MQYLTFEILSDVFLREDCDVIKSNIFNLLKYSYFNCFRQIDMKFCVWTNVCKKK